MQKVPEPAEKAQVALELPPEPRVKKLDPRLVRAFARWALPWDAGAIRRDVPELRVTRSGLPLFHIKNGRTGDWPRAKHFELVKLPHPRSGRMIPRRVYSDQDRGLTNATIAHHLAGRLLVAPVWGVGQHYGDEVLDRFIGVRHFVLDFDAHAGGDDDLHEARMRMLARYEAAMRALGHPPHLLVRSSGSGGLHCYVFLDRRCARREVTLAVVAALERCGVELRDGEVELFPSTASRPLRLPLGRGSCVVDPETMEPVAARFNRRGQLLRDVELSVRIFCGFASDPDNWLSLSALSPANSPAVSVPSPTEGEHSEVQSGGCVGTWRVQGPLEVPQSPERQRYQATAQAVDERGFSMSSTHSELPAWVFEKYRVEGRSPSEVMQLLSELPTGTAKTRPTELRRRVKMRMANLDKRLEEGAAYRPTAYAGALNLTHAIATLSRTPHSVLQNVLLRSTNSRRAVRNSPAKQRARWHRVPLTLPPPLRVQLTLIADRKLRERCARLLLVLLEGARALGADPATSWELHSKAVERITGRTFAAPVVRALKQLGILKRTRDYVAGERATSYVLTLPAAEVVSLEERRRQRELERQFHEALFPRLLFGDSMPAPA